MSAVVAKRFVPNVVVVDPRLDAYKPLAASARLGRIDIHFRSSGTAALKLARHVPVDAWLIAADLDDMSGHDLMALLQAELSAAGKGAGMQKFAVVDASRPGCRDWSLAEQDGRSAGADAILTQPITFRDLEQLLGLPTDERAKFVEPSASGHGFATLRVGVGAAVIAIAVLMMC